MKTILILLSLLLAGFTQATMIPLSAFRSVSVSGSAKDVNGDGAESSYSQSVSKTGLGDFSASLNSSIRQGRSQAQSQSSQESEINAGGISLHSFVEATEGLADGSFPFAQDSGAVGIARSIFDATFRLDAPMTYELDAFRSLFVVNPNVFTGLDFSLGSATYGTILSDLPYASLYEGGYLGTLLPDIYTMHLKTNMVAAGDPIGTLEGMEYGIDFRVASVPDSGSTLMLLGMAFVGIGIQHFASLAIYRRQAV